MDAAAVAAVMAADAAATGAVAADVAVTAAAVVVDAAEIVAAVAVATAAIAETAGKRPVIVRAVSPLTLSIGATLIPAGR